MTFSSQLKANDGASVSMAEAAENRLYAGSTLKSIFAGAHGLCAGWRLVMFLTMTAVLLAAFVLIRAGGVQAFLKQQKTAGQITATPLLMGGWSETG